jgi:hypothetical protein
MIPAASLDATLLVHLPNFTRVKGIRSSHTIQFAWDIAGLHVAIAAKEVRTKAIQTTH